jgi:hypothetical protein
MSRLCSRSQRENDNNVFRLEVTPAVAIIAGALRFRWFKTEFIRPCQGQLGFPPTHEDSSCLYSGYDSDVLFAVRDKDRPNKGVD